MNIQERIIKKGTILYRFVNVKPSEVKEGMTINKWKDGRCNKHHNIYYCCTSIDALNVELQDIDKANGSLICAEVLEDIVCGCVTDEETHKILRGRVLGEQQKMVHKELLSKFDYDIETNYAETNRITDKILRKYPEGIAYSSVNGCETIVANIVFYAAGPDDDFGPFQNIALTEKGFRKIKQLPPKKYI